MQGTQEEIVRCPNFMLCNSSHAQWVADCNHGVYTISFAGRLEFINKLEKCHKRKEILMGSMCKFQNNVLQKQYMRYNPHLYCKLEQS